MNGLRFRCLIDNYLCDITPFEAYVEKGAVDVGLVLIAFNENEIEAIRNLFKENVRDGHESYLNSIQLEGSDGYLYILSETTIEKKEKMPHSIMKAYRHYYKFKKKENKGKEWIKDNNAKQWIDANNKSQDNGLTKLSGGRFSAYRYNDTENKMCFPFRLVESKGKDKPLFVLFHGAGAMGNENIKQLFDNIPLYKQLFKEDCNVLLPQAPFGSNKGDDVTWSYVKSVKKLIDEIPMSFDRTRIYIVGTSFGGFCVWHSAYLFPEYFAAAVPVMGSLCFDCDFKKYDIQRLVKTPLWVAHSSDDTNVRIDSDDYYVAELEKLGADIKYTRWNKYGHSMSSNFYRKEKWMEWCLSKSNKRDLQ